MKANELRNLSIEDLKKKDSDIREDLFRLKFKHGIRKLENPAMLNQLRKNIAKIQTIIAEKNRDRSE